MFLPENPKIVKLIFNIYLFSYFLYFYLIHTQFLITPYLIPPIADNCFILYVCLYIREILALEQLTFLTLTSLRSSCIALCIQMHMYFMPVDF